MPRQPLRPATRLLALPALPALAAAVLTDRARTCQVAGPPRGSANRLWRVPFPGDQSAERLNEPRALADERRGRKAHQGTDTNDCRAHHLLTRPDRADLGGQRLDQTPADAHALSGYWRGGKPHAFASSVVVCAGPDGNGDRLLSLHIYRARPCAKCALMPLGARLRSHAICARADWRDSTVQDSGLVVKAGPRPF